jgi:predicted phage tail protein
MAKQMRFKSLTGVVCEESYWIPVQVNLNKIDKTGVVLFYGYASKEARDLGSLPVGQKTYAVSQEQFDLYFTANAINPEGTNQFLAAYVLAESTMEGERSLARVLDDCGNPTEELVPDERKSFFHEAVTV